ncbi:hypothetical protein TNCV_1204061 [Trichonephila clavipes]|nr:hypothetical protein TNCV_1204061 [Trichonephila clavipes]
MELAIETSPHTRVSTGLSSRIDAMSHENNAVVWFLGWAALTSSVGLYPGQFYSWGKEKSLAGPSRGCRWMRLRCHLVQGKILHYVAWCVVMVQPPIVKDGWVDSKNAFSQSC